MWEVVWLVVGLAIAYLGYHIMKDLLGAIVIFVGYVAMFYLSVFILGVVLGLPVERYVDVGLMEEVRVDVRDGVDEEVERSVDWWDDLGSTDNVVEDGVVLEESFWDEDSWVDGGNGNGNGSEDEIERVYEDFSQDGLRGVYEDTKNHVEDKGRLKRVVYGLNKHIDVIYEVDDVTLVVEEKLLRVFK